MKPGSKQREKERVAKMRSALEKHVESVLEKHRGCILTKDELAELVKRLKTVYVAYGISEKTAEGYAVETMLKAGPAYNITSPREV